MPPPRPIHISRLVRSYTTASPGPQTSQSFQVFNRRTKLLQRERAAADPTASRTVDYLKDLIADDIVERLMLINRRFSNVLDLGAGACHIAKALVTSQSSIDSSKFAPKLVRASDRITQLTCGELSEGLLYRDVYENWNTTSPLPVTRIALDEDAAALPFPSDTFDAVVSASSMHWINDLPHALGEVNRVLKPDAPFLAAMFGGDTLYELRTSLQLAELERRGGVSPRVSPMADTSDVGSLLDKAGFVLLTVDIDDVVVGYPDAFALMQDLQAMGEGNAVLARKDGQVGRDVLMAADGVYRELHGNEDGTLPATFRVIYMIGWKKGDNQPKPLERGSGEVSLKDVLGG